MTNRSEHSYSLIAYPGETNRLPFLIGPRYEVEGEAAFSHFSVANAEVSANNLTDRLAAVQWPVRIGFGEGHDSGGGCGCVVSVTNNAVKMTGVCSNDTCVHEGSYVYKGHRERFVFECGMEGGDGLGPGADESEESPDSPEASVSVWFEESAVIFEDEYENSPGAVVPRRSTRTTLRCTAYGGERGGNFTVDLSGMGALRLASGTPPSGRTLGPYESVEFEAVYEGQSASQHENGTVARATFTENETRTTIEDDAKITVVQVEVSPKAEFPTGYDNRHIFGVCEKFECWAEPTDIQILWGDVEDVVWDEIRDNYCLGFMPTYSCSKNITLEYGGESFDVHLSCVAPSGINARMFSLSIVSGIKGKAGDIGMFLDFSLLPSNVSFAGLRVSEEASSYGSHSGYFSDPSWSDKWCHTQENGAGTWHTVDSKSNYYAQDRAYIGYCEEPWSSGVLSWEIPNVWLPPSGRGGENIPFKTTFKVIWQTMSITSDGTVSVSKHGHTVSRSTNDVITINGVVWQ